jgi:hypothetical protein
MMLKHLLRRVLPAVLCLSCMAARTVQVAAQDKPACWPLKIGFMAELTGPNSENGQRCRQGHELAVKLYLPPASALAKKLISLWKTIRVLLPAELLLLKSWRI